MRWLFLPLLPALLLAGCTPAPAPGQKASPNIRVVQKSRAGNVSYGNGQNGRWVNGVKVYTVTVEFLMMENGRVRDAQVIRSDAPERLQQATLEAVEKFKFNPSPLPRVLRQSVIYHGIDVEPG